MKKLVFLLGIILASQSSVFCMKKLQKDGTKVPDVNELEVEYFECKNKLKYFMIKSSDELDGLVVSAVEASLALPANHRIECLGGVLYKILEPKNLYGKYFYVADGACVKLIKLDYKEAKQYLGNRIPINQNEIIRKKLKNRRLILTNLRARERSGILGVAVECVDLERNTDGEGSSK